LALPWSWIAGDGWGDEAEIGVTMADPSA